MAIYRYHSGTAIDEVRIVKNAAGGLRAYIHARSDAPPAAIAAAKAAFTAEGWSQVPYLEEGTPSLELRGFKTQDALLNCLAANGWVAGVPEVVKRPEDEVSREDRFHSATLRWTGRLYNLGDAAYMTYAGMELASARKAVRAAEAANASLEVLKAKKMGLTGAKAGIAGGVGYAIGGTVLSAFGSKDQSASEIRHASEKIQYFLQTQGKQVAPDSLLSVAAENKPKSFGARLKAFVSRYPSEILNTVYTGVGILLAISSIKRVGAERVPDKPIFSKENAHLSSDITDIGLGTVTTASSLIGLLVKEKKIPEGQSRKHGFAGVWEWIQEKPLRATGIGFFIATLFHASSTVEKFRKGDKAIRETVFFRGVFVAANIIAEALLFASSKGHGQGVKADDSVERTVVASTAEYIARQNPANQQALIDQLAGYMASPEVLGIKAEKIAADLREHLSMLSRNPWAAPAPAAAAAAAPPAPLAPVVPLYPATPRTKIEAASIADHSLPNPAALVRA